MEPVWVYLLEETLPTSSLVNNNSRIEWIPLELAPLGVKSATEESISPQITVFQTGTAPPLPEGSYLFFSVLPEEVELYLQEGVDGFYLYALSYGSRRDLIITQLFQGISY